MTDDDADTSMSTDEEIAALRAENARLAAEVEDARAEHRSARSARGRWFLSIALVVLGAVLLPLAVATVWTRNQVLDTDRYLETIAPLSDDPVVIAALSTRISNAVAEEIDVKSLAQESLPDNASFLAAPIAAGAQTLIQEATTRLLESDQFDTLWLEANRTGHDALVAVLTGRKGTIVDTEDGKVVISLGPLVQRVLDRLDDEFGTNISSRVPADKIDIEYAIIDSPQLANLQTQVRWLDRLSWISLVLVALCFIGAVFAATDRRKGFLRVGIGIAASMLVMLISMSLGRETYLSNLPSQVTNTAAAAAVFDALVRFLLQAFRVLLALGVVVLFAAWVAGPSRAATWIRTVWDRALGRSSSGIGGTVELGPVPVFFARHLGAIRGAIAVLAAAALVLWTRPTGKVVVLIAVVALVVLAVTQVLAGIATPEDSGEDSSGDDTVGDDTVGDDTVGDDTVGDLVADQDASLT